MDAEIISIIVFISGFVIFFTILCIIALASPTPAQAPPPKISYWEEFKKREPFKAQDIEKLVCGRDMSQLSDTDAAQIVRTILSWSSTQSIPIGKLKSYFLNEIVEKKMSSLSKEDIINELTKKREAEAIKYNIAKENTLSHLLIQLIQNNRLHDKSDIIADVLREVGIDSAEREIATKRIKIKDDTIEL